ncbi:MULTISPECIES: amidohydrolase family protein [unclassified Bradyrhizobium]|uniref:amidohydrolase family protein n=1 Tax=unclassified Bradyrhizobium TaxID=2631580 RepID=UPI001FFBED6C|nr:MULTISPECIES: amidohydrolase family protein [unclassified Bradyrhizobium]
MHLLTGLAGAALANEARAQGAEPKAIPTIAPPDANPKTPSFKLPAKSCDSHIHIFGPASRYPFAEKRRYNTADAPLEAFRSVHEKIGVERSVIVNATVHGTDNRLVTDAS